jgi:Protein of unknown function (DUF1553)/Protein of unknown function (DUF1549)
MDEKFRVSKKKAWAKHLLLVSVILGVGLGVAATLRPEPQLKRLPNDMQRFNDSSFSTVVDRINSEMDAAIQKANLPSAPEADWLVACRRLSLALVGNGLSLEEIRAIEQVPETDRVRWWTNYLLQDNRSSNYLSERLTRAYVGTNNGPFILYRRRRFQLWLADQLQKNRPYDEIVRDMISAEGLWTDQPAVNFLTATMDENDTGRADPIRLAGRTTRAFLGMRMDCMQCHDDFLDKVNLGSDSEPIPGTQHHFHELASFYAGARLSQNIFSGLRDDKQDYNYKFLDDETDSKVEPKVPFHSELLPTDGNPRQRLARWVTHTDNKPFARATVNRVWALMFGRPLVDPVDDMSLNGPFPAALETLAEDFAKNKFDMKRLISMISETKAFRRDSRSTDFDVTQEHENSWAVFPLTQLRPEQVAASINQACRLKAVDDDSSIIAQVEKFGYVNDFIKNYGDRGEDEFNAQSVTIPQRLLVMNGGLVEERSRSNPLFNATNRLANIAENDTKAVESAYLATLNRLPSENESKELACYLENKRGEERVQAMSDIYWILLNSTEFLWNH